MFILKLMSKKYNIINKKYTVANTNTMKILLKKAGTLKFIK